jgi:hypothetical protein
MRPGREIRLGKRGDKLTIDEVPVQRLYRKTMEGIVEIADSAWHLLMKRKQRAYQRPVDAPCTRASLAGVLLRKHRCSLPCFPVLLASTLCYNTCPT